MTDQQRLRSKVPDVRLQVALENALTDARSHSSNGSNDSSLVKRVAPILRNATFNPGTRIKAGIRGMLRPLGYHLRDFLARDVRFQLGDLAASLQRHGRDMQEQVQTTVTQIKNLDAMATTQAQQFRRLADGLTDQVSDVQAGLERLEDAAGQMQQLQRSVVGLTDQVDGLQARLARLELADQLAGLQARLERLEGQIQASRGLIEILANRNVLALSDDAVLVRTPFGYVYCPRDDDALVVYLSDEGQLERGLGKLLDRVLGAGMVFVDVGANVGYHTLHAARLVGEEGQVWAFEPTPSVFDLLKRSLILNGLSERVLAHNLALGADTRLANLYVSRRSAHNSLYALPQSDGAVQVPVRRLDKVMPADQKLHAIKIDVEGAELDVLRGMTGVLRANRDAVLIAEYGPSHLARTRTAKRDWFNAFFDLGYDGFAIKEPHGTCVPIAQLDLDRVLSVNIAFVTPESVLRAKVLGS